MSPGQSQHPSGHLKERVDRWLRDASRRTRGLIPAPLTEEEHERLRRTVQTTIMIIMGVDVLAVVLLGLRALMVGDPLFAAVALASGVLFPFLAALYFMNQAGYTIWAAHGMVVGLLGTFLAYSVVLADQGVLDGNLSFTLVVIVLAGFLLRPHFTILYGGSLMFATWVVRDLLFTLDHQMERALLVQGLLLAVVATFGVLRHREVRDMQRRRAAMERRQGETEAILGGAPDAILAVDTAGHVRTFNDAARRLAREAFGTHLRPGISMEAGLSKPVAEFLEPQVQAALHGEAGTVNYERYEPPERIFAIHFAPIDGGGQIDGACIHVQDLTETRTAWEHSQKELERDRQRLLNLVSHELSTPLTPTLMQLRLLRDALEEGQDISRATKATQAIERNVYRFERTVRLLTTVSRAADRSALELERRDLGTLVREVSNEMRSRLRQHRSSVSVVSQIGLVVNVDKAKISQVIKTLLGNAARHGGPHISVRVSKVDDHAHVSVTDDGPGVPESRQDDLFEPLSLSDGQDGHSLAIRLYVARMGVEQHGGKIWHEEPMSGGARFTFSLPLTTTAEKPHGPEGGVTIETDQAPGDQGEVPGGPPEDEAREAADAAEERWRSLL